MKERIELNKSTIDSYVNDLKQKREPAFFGMVFYLKRHYNQMTFVGTNELTNLLINEFLNRDIQITHVKQSKLFFSACRKLVSKTFGVSGIVMNAGILYQALGDTIILKRTYPTHSFLNQYHPIRSTDELQSYLKTMEALIAEANKDPNYLELREKIELQIKSNQTEKDNYLNKSEKNIFFALYRYAELMDACLSIDYSYAKALQDLLFKITLKHAAPNEIQVEFDIIFNEFKYDQHRQRAFYLSFYEYLEKNWSGAELDLLKGSIRPSDKEQPIVSKSYSEKSHKLMLGEVSSPKTIQHSKSKDKGASGLSNWSIFRCCCFKGDDKVDDTKIPLISVNEDKQYGTFELG